MGSGSVWAGGKRSWGFGSLIINMGLYLDYFPSKRIKLVTANLCIHSVKHTRNGNVVKEQWTDHRPTHMLGGRYSLWRERGNK